MNPAVDTSLPTPIPVSVNERADTASRPKRRGAGLRIKFLLLVSVGFIVSGTLFGWSFSAQFEQMLRLEFQKRGETLVRGLAASARLDVYSGNKERLTRLVESAREEADVVAVTVYDSGREVLASSQKIPGVVADRPPQIPRSGVVVESRAATTGGQALAFLAPVRLFGGAPRGTDALDLLEPRSAPARSEVLGGVEIVFSLVEVERRIREVQRSTMWLTAAVVAVGIVLVIWLSRVIIGPIERIAATAHRIAAGDRRSRAIVNSRDELGKLADAFNVMTTALGRSEDELRRMNARLEQKVRERTSELELNQEQLIAANVELERASRLKSEFLANMSHELRTPLNAINGFSQLLLEQTFGELNAKQKRYCDNILASGEHLLQLINSILDLSKIEAGRLEVHREEFSIRQTIENAVAVIQPLAQKKRLAVEFTIESGLDRVQLDPGKTKQVLYNLMSNSVKFTDSGKVSVSASRMPAPENWIEIVVADTGIGIDPDDQKRLFREFEQIDGSHSRRHEGTGLGLALTKKLVELMGGTIHVESEPGCGSRFFARLPIREAKAAGKDAGA